MAAPPVEGRANEATRALLAEVLGLAKDDVELTGGESSRAKRFRLHGLPTEDIDKRLRVALEESRPPQERPSPGR